MAMSLSTESAKIFEFCQNASNSDKVENEVQIEAIGDHSLDEVGVTLINPDVVNCENSKIINYDKSESEQHFSSYDTQTNTTGITSLNGMRGDDTDSADVCDQSDHSQDDDTEDGVDDILEDLSHEGYNCHSSNGCSNGPTNAHPVANNHIVIIETVVKSDTNGVILITESTVNTDNSTDIKINQSFTDSSFESMQENINNNNNSSDRELKDMTTHSKKLKSLLKKGLKDSTKTSNGRKRVTFSETMQVFCDDWPQNLMPQIIALKSPTDFNLVEVQGYMFEPPVEYQDFLPFEPPPDYRDLIANSLCSFDNDLSINYIDDEEEDNTFVTNNRSYDQKFIDEFSSKLESMILNNNESLEEEQIIGVLKEDAILQAIGSHVEEQLCQEDFPIHFYNNDSFETNDSSVKLAESELSDINSEDGNDSSPTGSLQDIDIASDSSITSQDTIILMFSDNNDNSNNTQSLNGEESNSNFNDLTNSETLLKSMPQTDDELTKVDSIDGNLKNGTNTETSDSLKTIEANENGVNVKPESYDRIEVFDTTPDVSQNNSKEEQTNETEKSESGQNDENNVKECEINSSGKVFNIFTSEETSAMQMTHNNAFKRNLMFYENMLLDKNDSNIKINKPIKQSHTVNHLVLQNNKFPIFMPNINNINNENVNEDKSDHLENVKDLSLNNRNNINYRPVNNSLSSQSLQSKEPTQQTQPNEWSTNELLIEYTSEPRTLVPSKRTTSLSSFTTANIITPNQQIHLKNSDNNHNINNNNNNINYLSLNRNGEPQQKWKLYPEQHNSQQIRYHYNPNQRAVSPNPRPVSPNARPVTPHQIFYQNRPQFNPRYPSSQSMPLQVMYSRTPDSLPINQRVRARFPTMSSTLPPHHKHPPPYSYYIQQHSNEFPNPSEIRRRDGLNAYPYTQTQPPQAGALPVPPIHHNQHNTQTLSKDELEQFVQQDIQRTERIKKRYSLSEEDDPSFGFARRPSVRGIRPKYGSTNEILKQMQSQTGNSQIYSSQTAGNHVSWPQTNSNNSNNNQLPTQNSQSFQKMPQMVKIIEQQMPITVKHMSELQNQDFSQQPHSRTLPRPSSLISQSQMKTMRSEEGLEVIKMFANSNNTNRDQHKQQIQRQLEQQLQPKLHKKITSMSSINIKPVMSSNDERGVPEGASSSPKHSSDLLFAKNVNTSVNNIKSGELSAKKTKDTKKLVINEETNTNNKLSQDNGVIYYSMNV